MFGFRKKRDLFAVLYQSASVAAAPAPAQTAEEPPLPTISVEDLPSVGAYLSRAVNWDGEKYYGGYGPVEILTKDYWALRARSSELFDRNLYARGLIRRLVTNEINTGLFLEATPHAGILGLDEEKLADWSSEVEARFTIWGSLPDVCSTDGESNFGELQATIRTEALIDGDILVVNRRDPRTKLPQVELINGASVRTPPKRFLDRQGVNRVREGVELDAKGRHVAYWVGQEDGTYKRLPAFGEKSGRKLAWLVYGSDKRHAEVRGQPILSLALQSVKEIDRYRDAVQRKAVVNGILAMFIKKSEDKPGTRGISSGAISRGVATSTNSDGQKRSWNIAEQHPGLILEELQHGEEPHGFVPNGTDEKFGDFEAAIVHTLAWAHEVPPEILQLAFTDNYSASQAAINEFKMYLDRVRTKFGNRVCFPIYADWLHASVLMRKVRAPGFLESLADPMQWDIRGAWLWSDWSGHVKPSVDALKLVKAATEATDGGFTTRGRACRELNGMKFEQVVRQLERENRLLAKAKAPLVELERGAAVPPASAAEGTEEEGDDEGEDTDPKNAGAKLHVVT